jgi:hypothetical protein
MVQFVEEQLYITTRGVDMRPHGIVPAGTVVRAVELFETNHVAFEFVNPVEDLVGYDGDWIPALGVLRTLVPFEPKLSVLARARAHVGLGARVAAILAVALLTPSIWELSKPAKAWKGPVVDHLTMTLDKREVPLGGTLVYTTRMKILRQCEWRWFHEWSRVRPDGSEQLITHDSRIGRTGKRPLGENLTFKVEQPLPAEITTPGEYVWQGAGQANCDGDVTTIDEGEHHFIVY